MDSLRATYKDDDEEEDEEVSPVPTPTTNEIELTPHTTKEEAGISDGVSEEELSEEENEEEEEEEEEEVEDLQQLPTQQHSQSPNPTTTPSEEEEETPPQKKHKPLCSLTPQIPGRNVLDSRIVANPISKKPKKKAKSNNVWKSTSRKGKKKSKPNAHQVVAEKSILISPIPRIPDKTDDSPDMQICLSKVYKAEKVELSDDRLSAGSSKGYRMVRATRGVTKGAWYFEIKVEKLGETGHTRLGWSTEKGDLQAPVGYDGNSFGYRDIDGSKIHKAMREKYGEGGYVEGDVIGCYINLPDGDLFVPKTPNWVWYKGQKFACPANGKEDSNKVVPGSEISFFKNGVCQGVAFKDLPGGCYYPAASMYTLPNQPNCAVKFNFGPEFEFFPDFGDRTVPAPMNEVPYHSFDANATINRESVEKTPENNS